jgi:Flp pilus assembly protein TadG
MAELALVMPILLLALIGILEFGRLFNYWIDTTHLANETARWVVVDRVPGTGAASTRVRDYICSQAQTAEERSGMEVRFRVDSNLDNTFETTAAATINQGDPVMIEVRRAFSVVPFLNTGTITFTGKSTMRIERLGGSNGTAPSTYGFFDWSTCP